MSRPEIPHSVRRWVLLNVVVALVAIVGGLLYVELDAIDHPPKSSTSSELAGWVSPPSLTTMFDYQPTLLAVGDPPGVIYPYLVTYKMGWSLASYALERTDFVHGVDNLMPRLKRADSYRVDYVLVDCGFNDLGEAPDQVVAAAEQYIKDVRSQWPTATIIIVLPAAFASDAGQDHPEVADGLRRTADSVGARVIDPAAQLWFRGVEMGPLLSLDGSRLNDAGQDYYADKIVENLKQMGFTS